MVSFLLKGGEDPPPYPQKGTLESAGWDLFFPADVFLNPGEKKGGSACPSPVAGRHLWPADAAIPRCLLL